jgi:sugar/nucleoside kinase (ribokinase family)
MSERFVAIGNMSIDDLVFADGSTKWAVPGGNAIYSALGMAVWGERPQVIAPRGPEYPVAGLGSRIDLSRCPTRERTLRNWGLYEEDGTRTFTFRTKTRNWLEYCPTPADLGEEVFEYCHLAPLPWSLHIEFAEVLRAKGARLISIDPDDRYISSVPEADITRLLRSIDVLLPSRQDIDAMFPRMTPLDGLRALRMLAPDLPLIVVKCGEEGAIAHGAGTADYIKVPAASGAFEDATGAGDSFCGGALVGLARTGDHLDAVLYGAVSASFAVAAVGPTALIDAPREVAERRLASLCGRVEVHSL